jgi:hypothetical protein
MLPAALVERLDEQEECNPRLRRPQDMQADVLVALDELGIDRQTQIAEFLMAYRLHAVKAVRGFRQLLDICEPVRHIRQTTEFTRGFFGLSDDFICLDTAEGEGYIVYSKSTGAIHEGGLPEVDALNARTLAPTWASFFDLMLDYTMPGFIPAATDPQS